MSPEPQVLSYQLKSFWVPGRKLGLSFASVKTRSIWKESSKYAQHRHSGRTSACRRMGMQFLMPVISDGVSHQSLPLVVNLCLSLMLSASVCSSSFCLHGAPDLHFLVFKPTLFSTGALWFFKQGYNEIHII